MQIHPALFQTVAVLVVLHQLIGAPISITLNLG